MLALAVAHDDSAPDSLPGGLDAPVGGVDLNGVDHAVAHMIDAVVLQARKDGKERVVPDSWREYAESWLQGFDGDPLVGAGKAKPVSDQMEAEVDELAVDRPAGT